MQASAEAEFGTNHAVATDSSLACRDLIAASSSLLYLRESRQDGPSAQVHHRGREEGLSDCP